MIGRRTRSPHHYGAARRSESGTVFLASLVWCRKELAHVMLHEPSTLPTDHHRGRREVEAESVAYIVCRHAGLATDDYSLPYVAGWSGGDRDVVRETAERVTGCARTVLRGVETASGPALPTEEHAA